MRPVLRLWLPVIAWAALIFALSAIPSLSSGLGGWDLVLRKAAHVVEFAILGALLVRAIGTAAPALVLGVAYAATDEWHQSFVRGREGRPGDVAIDAIGLLFGVLVWRKLQATSRSRRPAAEAPAGSTTTPAS